MRNWITFVLLLALVNVSYGAAMFKGAKELAIEGYHDSDSLDGEHTELTVFYGEFSEDNLELGFQVGIRDTENSEQWRGGIRIEYNKTEFQVVPYVALTLEYVYFELETPQAEVLVPDGTVMVVEEEMEDADDDAFVVGGHAGLKYFLAENIAIAGAIVYEWATEDIYDAEDGRFDDTDVSLRLGMRFFF